MEVLCIEAQGSWRRKVFGGSAKNRVSAELSPRESSAGAAFGNVAARALAFVSSRSVCGSPFPPLLSWEQRKAANARGALELAFDITPL
jgi:hypothetical protein